MMPDGKGGLEESGSVPVLIYGRHRVLLEVDGRKLAAEIRRQMKRAA